MIAFATKFPNVFIDTSACRPWHHQAEIVAYMKAHGRQEMMFGTNYPMITPAACLEELSLLDLDGETREAFLAGNAKRVFAL